MKVKCQSVCIWPASAGGDKYQYEFVAESDRDVFPRITGNWDNPSRPLFVVSTSATAYIPGNVYNLEIK